MAEAYLAAFRNPQIAAVRPAVDHHVTHSFQYRTLDDPFAAI
jgi:hypothetical protein